MISQPMVDRIKINVNYEPYLTTEGFITSFNIDGLYNNKIEGGFSTDGSKNTRVIGNKSFSFSWTEYLVDLAKYINWDEFLKINPDTVIQFIPFSLFSNIPLQVTYTCQGIVCKGAPVSFSGEGNAASRSLSFECCITSNL